MSGRVTKSDRKTFFRYYWLLLFPLLAASEAETCHEEALSAAAVLAAVAP